MRVERARIEGGDGVVAGGGEGRGEVVDVLEECVFDKSVVRLSLRCVGGGGECVGGGEMWWGGVFECVVDEGVRGFRDARGRAEDCFVEWI